MAGDNDLLGLERCVLNHAAGAKHFDISRAVASRDLEPYVENYWIVRWDLRGRQPYLQETLPHPSVNLTVIRRDEHVESGVHGVKLRKFGYLLRDAGLVVGVKFRPSGFAAFTDTPIHAFTGRSVPLHDVFGRAGDAFQKELLAVEDEDRALIARAETFLRGRQPAEGAQMRFVREVVDWIVAAGDLTKVDELVDTVGVDKRTLERLFLRYVGVSPKWVIQRSRLHAATELLVQGRSGNGAGLAQRLGYADQAHFIRDFKRIVERTPGAYGRLNRA